MSLTYDSIIIGAGIAGASLAHALTQKKQKVLVLDKIGIASGGSGAAGAFISPKIGKVSELHLLTNEAYTFAKDFYIKYTAKHFHQTGVVRIPKDKEDALKFPMYESYNTTSYSNYKKKDLEALGILSSYESFYFPDAGDCDSTEVCYALLEGIEVLSYEVKKIEKKEALWYVGEYRCKTLILATGYENTLVDLAYMGIKGTWGTRADFYSSAPLATSMHQSMSISSHRNNFIKLGATHEHTIKTPISCEDKEALALKAQAKDLIDTSDLLLKETFCGMRAGAKDYFPLVGKVIDVAYMLETYPSIRKGTRPQLQYKENLYVFNGLGGRGFVLAPLMAQILSEHIVEKKDLDTRVSPDRLFLKWCRKLQS